MENLISQLFIHNKERRTCLLAFSPLRDETSQDASSHVLFLEDTLKLYGKTISNVCCLIGDNCSTNKAVANLFKIPLIGCYSHILNLAVKNIFLEDGFAKAVLPKVVEIMRVLSTPKGAAQLRSCFVDCTGLKAIKKNETRWTSTHDMLERYIKLLPHLSQIEEASIVKKNLNPGDNLFIRELLSNLELINTMMKYLQREDITLADARKCFDATLEDFPHLARYLATDADIIHKIDFTNGIIKIQNQKSADLT